MDQSRVFTNQLNQRPLNSGLPQEATFRLRPNPDIQPDRKLGSLLRRDGGFPSEGTEWVSKEMPFGL